MFHLLRENGILFLCMTSTDAKRRIAFAFLDDIKTKLFEQYGSTVHTAIAFAFQSSFAPVLKRQMVRRVALGACSYPACCTLLTRPPSPRSTSATRRRTGTAACATSWTRSSRSWWRTLVRPRCVASIASRTRSLRSLGTCRENFGARRED